jgi:KDO2-lipid IV(A) lauroyltransferase
MLWFQIFRLGQSPALQALSWRLEALVVRLFWGLCSVLPVERASRLGRGLARRFGPHLRKTRKLHRNLALVRPELDPASLEALVRDAWGNYGAVLAEFPQLRQIWQSGRVEVRGHDNVRPAVEAGRGVVFAMAHVGNWNVAALVARDAGLPLAVVQSPFSNPHLEAIYRHCLDALGCDFIYKQSAPREGLRRLRAGESVAFLCDVRIDPGLPIPMFGQPVPTTIIPARMALKCGCDLIPVLVARVGECRFLVDLGAPIRPEDPDLDPRAQAIQMTHQLNDRFTDWIRKRPEQWLCFKRRAYKAGELPASSVLPDA